MPIKTKYLLIASMDVEQDKEALFNEVYDLEHVPSLLEVPGVTSITRLTAEPLIMNIGGQNRSFPSQGEPAYSAIYEVESPDVLVSKEWAGSVEMGRWPELVRPHTKNRRHVLCKIILQS